MTTYTRCILIGMSGTGKSHAGRRLAERLGWALIDTDQAITQREGRSIPEIFARDGEAHFRAVEREVLLAALRQPQAVIATGGGAVLADELWSPALLLDPEALTVALDASPATSLHRLRDQAARDGATTARPLLAGDEPLARLVAMKLRRLPAYDRAPLTLDVDHRTVDEVVAEIVALMPRDPGAPSLRLEATSGSSDIFIGAGMLDRLPALLAERWPRARTTWLAIDANVARVHGDRLRALLGRANGRLRTISVPPGEGSKSVAGISALWDRMLDDGVERGDVLVAAGGGVTGDLVGFAAATVLRGINLVQVPTSLLAMVDSSVGGKTGINHRAGKNLIGSFYQPPLVVIDPDLLASLPPRELTSGWAEVLKHAVIQRATPGGDAGDLLTTMERSRARFLHRDQPAISWMIRRNVALKAAVVQADEQERGLRAILNFGHTVGHAIEAAGYNYLHGEAVAVGMCAAIRISHSVGLVDAGAVARLESLIAGYGLPTRAAASAADVRQLMTSDKKRAAGTQRWVLAKDGAGVVIASDVPESVVNRAIDAVLEQPAGAALGRAG